jgi:hypothetical protein
MWLTSLRSPEAKPTDRRPGIGDSEKPFVTGMGSPLDGSKRCLDERSAHFVLSSPLSVVGRYGRDDDPERPWQVELTKILSVGRLTVA